MERRQEVEYRDPFDLLRNMNDVLYVYGEKPIAAPQIQPDNFLPKRDD